MKTSIGGRVIKMEDATGFPVAVKRWYRQERRADKAKWEQEMLYLVQGKGVPKFIRFFEDADYFYVVTEWISGVTLDKYLEEQGGYLSQEEALKIASEIFRLLKRLHNNSRGSFVYVDLKPSNIIIKGRDVFLVDFESVCPSGKVPISCDEQTVIMASRPFTAPEVFTGKISPECDYYSIGVLLFYMITGKLWQNDPSLLENNIIKNRILKLLNIDPSKRKAGLKLLNKDEIIKEECIVIPIGSSNVREGSNEISISNAKVLFIDNNPRFAIEMAYEASMHMNLKIGVFSTGEEHIPMAAKSLGIRCLKFPNQVIDEVEPIKNLFDSCSINEWMEKGYLMQPEGYGRLYLGLKSPEKLMHNIDCKAWGMFIHWLSQKFDIAIISGHIETDYLVTFCDAIIMPSQSNLWDAQICSHKNRRIKLNELSVPVKFVAWEYKEGISIPGDKFAAIVGEANFLGEIYHDGNRQIAENMDKTPYCFSMPEIIKQQYQTVIQKITKN